MTVLPISSALTAAAESNLLVVPSVIFPLIAVGVFMLLGAVTWSYRDVSNRHANTPGGDAPHGPTH